MKGQLALSESDILDLAGVAALLEVSPYTPSQWRQRSREGRMSPPMPEPDYPSVRRPIWKRSTIVNWAQQCDPPRWPPGATARPEMRGERGPRKRTRRTLTIEDALAMPEAQVFTGTNPSVPPAIFMEH